MQKFEEWIARHEGFMPHTSGQNGVTGMFKMGNNFVMNLSNLVDTLDDRTQLARDIRALAPAERAKAMSYWRRAKTAMDRVMNIDADEAPRGLYGQPG